MNSSSLSCVLAKILATKDTHILYLVLPASLYEAVMATANINFVVPCCVDPEEFYFIDTFIL